MSTTIPQNVLPFLKDLEKNNNRDWFNERKPEFKALKNEFKLFCNALLTELNKHDKIEKMKLFRIYRDVRFSKNKMPYKTHLACSYRRLKPELRGGYYLHIKPNNESFIATGFWDPNKDDLMRIRKEFEIDASEIRAIIENDTFKTVWGSLEGEELKTAPRGFDKDHDAIDLIRKKQFVFTKKFTDDDVLHPDFIKTVDDSFRVIRPYFDYMSDVLTTDLNGVSLV